MDDIDEMMAEKGLSNAWGEMKKLTEKLFIDEPYRKSFSFKRKEDYDVSPIISPVMCRYCIYDGGAGYLTCPSCTEYGKIENYDDVDEYERRREEWLASPERRNGRQTRKNANAGKQRRGFGRSAWKRNANRKMPPPISRVA